uniref:Chemokine interleukin-8-like domain-containing protein n=1 Tax=Capra hircus TaxID=9925 RepID=A0A8C2SBI8_CAPHI
AANAAARLLGAAMLLLLLVAAGAPVVNELRCQCLQTVQGIHLKNMQSVKVTPPGPHCGQAEVIGKGEECCFSLLEQLLKKTFSSCRASSN